MKIGKEEKIDLYKTMLTVRAFEEEAGKLFSENLIPGFIHLSIGEEASSVGTCSALRNDDYVASTHRGHGHLIAKGAEPKKMFAELFGKITGYCKGKGGSMHIADFSLGILGANGVVGGGFPIMVGAGLSIKLRKTDQVGVVFLEMAQLTGGHSMRLLIWHLYGSFPLSLSVRTTCTHLQHRQVIPSQEALWQSGHLHMTFQDM